MLLDVNNETYWLFHIDFFNCSTLHEGKLSSHPFSVVLNPYEQL